MRTQRLRQPGDGQRHDPVWTELPVQASREGQCVRLPIVPKCLPISRKMLERSAPEEKQIADVLTMQAVHAVPCWQRCPRLIHYTHEEHDKFFELCKSFDFIIVRAHGLCVSMSEAPEISV